MDRGRAVSAWLCDRRASAAIGSRSRLLIVDEVGYLPLERQSANLLFALFARRYERGSIIVTSNRGFEAWAEILGDQMIAAAIIDRLVHHATMIHLKGKSHRLRERGTGAVTPTASTWRTIQIPTVAHNPVPLTILRRAGSWMR